MLISGIDEEFSERLSVCSDFLDQIKFYMNPEVYKMEQDMKDGTHEDYTTRNALHADHHNYGQATGKINSPKFMKDAIASFYEDEANDPGGKGILVVTEDDIYDLPQDSNDQDVLG